ncbi:prephenate dehydrogenase [Streptomyces massasporeus]|uniref:prephenate dehydrogenase n=1 Tax=Streptomyces massasporeus TaxID=67324 RepID=UPI00340DE27F
MRSALVVGTGLMGASVGLALRGRGIPVHLRDEDATAARTAEALGAGTRQAPAQPVDLAIVAVPPPLAGCVLADLQAEGVARHYTDIASVKSEVEHAAVALGCDMSRFIGGHPMADGARSGPLTARADLFDGCMWALTPSAATSTETLNTTLELVALCGATPVLMEAPAHDRAVALVSHAPHIVTSLVAKRLACADEREVSLAGAGLRDLTRIAQASPPLWLDVLSANAAAVADVLEELGADLGRVVAALRAIASTDEAKRSDGADLVGTVLHQGRAGGVRVSGTRGKPQRFDTVTVAVGDQPGELARLFADIHRTGVNIEDIRLEHGVGRGLAHLSIASGRTESLREALSRQGWRP